MQLKKGLRKGEITYPVAMKIVKDGEGSESCLSPRHLQRHHAMRASQEASIDARGGLAH